MTKEEARQLITHHLSRYGEVELIEEATEEYDFGWVFYYQSKAYLDTGDNNEFLCGNAPCIVDRERGEIIETGTAFPIEDYIKAYRACGDPHGEPTGSVAIFGFSHQKETNKAIRLVHQICQTGLSEAKLIIDGVLGGDRKTIDTRDRDEAAKLERALNDLGFKAQQVYEVIEMQSRGGSHGDIEVLDEDWDFIEDDN